MATHGKMPKTLDRLAANCADKIESIHVELDEFGGRKSPFSYWVYLNPGWICDEVHHVHEITVSDVMFAMARVVRCQCEDCKRAS